MSNGLVSNEIRSVVQDRTGYLWIASNNGLQRYDGMHYKTFQHRDDDPNSLPMNFIWQLLMDDDDNLWVLTAYGQVGLFDKKLFTYTPISVHVQHPASLWAMKFLLKDGAGNIFFLLHANELLLFDRQKKQFRPANDFLGLQPDWKITSFAQQPGTKKYWLALAGGGVAICNKQTGRTSYPGNNAEHEPAVDSLQRFHNMAHFLFDSKGRLWAENWDAGPFPQIILYDGKSNGQKVKTYEFLSTLKTYNEIHGFAEQKNGQL
ncbi:MAG TPA: two-component regulator propeller domain-containing protein, partial [Flavisolibacter sp.]|nr:two-component regulator propeller domain-containing protein [Flavisolibacter sp.]